MPSAGENGTRRVAMLAVMAMVALLMLSLLASPETAQQPAPSPKSQGGLEFDSSTVTPAMVNAGRAIFHEKGICFACHGPQLEGTQIAPTLKAHAWRDAKNGELAAILGVVSHGVPSTAMVSFPGGISPAEARSVAAYVWSVGRGRAKP